MSDETSGRPSAADQEPDPAASDEEMVPATEVTELRDRLTEATDRYRRALADLDNFRKRTQRDGDRRAAQARDAQLREWLEALDSVERALQVEPEDPGLTAVLQQMEAILARHDIQRLARVGDHFDPQRHEAIAAQPSKDVANNTIMAVTRSGFGRSDGEVVREAQVVVAKNPGQEQEPQSRPGPEQTV